MSARKDTGAIYALVFYIYSNWKIDLPNTILPKYLTLVDAFGVYEFGSQSSEKFYSYPSLNKFYLLLQIRYWRKYFNVYSIQYQYLCILF